MRRALLEFGAMLLLALIWGLLGWMAFAALR